MRSSSSVRGGHPGHPTLGEADRETCASRRACRPDRRRHARLSGEFHAVDPQLKSAYESRAETRGSTLNQSEIRSEDRATPEHEVAQLLGRDAARFGLRSRRSSRNRVGEGASTVVTAVIRSTGCRRT